tara:strand:- start:366 stop:467 length:102 start_codon:yes stop_codon:yes gene_type:complete
VFNQFQVGIGIECKNPNLLVSVSDLKVAGVKGN